MGPRGPPGPPGPPVSPKASYNLTLDAEFIQTFLHCNLNLHLLLFNRELKDTRDTLVSLESLVRL